MTKITMKEAKEEFITMTCDLPKETIAEALWDKFSYVETQNFLKNMREALESH